MIALIDCDSLLYFAACHEERNTWDSVVIDFHARVSFILQQTGCEEFCLFVGGGKSYRHFVTSRTPYKGKRKPGKYPLLAALKHYVKSLPYTYVCQNIEADDAVSILNTEIKESLICSPDKDVLLQNAGKHYDYKKDIVVFTEDDEAEYGLNLQLMMGDSGDNIPGIEGVGIKTAQKKLEESTNVLQHYIEKYGKLKGNLYYAETFYLVYLLKNYDDLTTINAEECKNLKAIEFGKSKLHTTEYPAREKQPEMFH